MRQIGTEGELQSVPPSEVRYVGVTFSSDGNHIFYTTYDRKGEFGSLYRVSVLGGLSEKVLFDIDSGAAADPSNKRLAFIRYVIAKDGSVMSHLVTAAQDGSDQRILATLTGNKSFEPVTPVWSTDGRRLLVCVRQPGELSEVLQLATVPAATGGIDVVPALFWNVTGMAWTPDGKHVLTTAQALGREPSRPVYVIQGPSRLWLVSMPTGDRAELTRDVNLYEGVSLSADGRTVITTRRDISSRISVWDDTELRPLTGEGYYDGREGLEWINEDEIIFTSNRSGPLHLWKVKPTPPDFNACCLAPQCGGQS